MLDIDGVFAIPDEEFSFTFARSSGPGGQNVNKVNSKAILTWSPVESPSLPGAVRLRFLARFASRLTNEGKLVIASQRYRDRPRNIEDCRQKLVEMLRSVLAPPKARRPTKPSRGAKERRLESKRRRSEAKARRRPVAE